MRLAWKLILALLPALFAVIAVFGWIRIEREMALLREDSGRDQRVVATTLARAVETVWARQGEAAAIDMIRDADAQRSMMRIRWVELGAGASAATAPSLEHERLRALDHDRPLQAVLASNPFGTTAESLVTYAAAEVGGRRIGAVEITESLEPLSGYLRQTLVNTLLLSLTVAVVCVGVTLFVGSTLITRPVELLIRRAREIGAKQTTAPLGLRQRDELGELASVLDAAAVELKDATDKADAEALARLATQEQLRHAERLATAGKLATVLAHEIGTPLNVASGHAQLVASRRLAGDGVVESAKIIKGQCDRIAQLVRQLLDFAARRAPKPAPTDLVDLTRVTVDLLEPLAKRREVALEFRGVSAASATVDSFQVQQALTNLIMNAIHISPKQGRVTISVSEEARVPAESTPGTEPEDYVVVSVEDQGPGIAEADRQRVFEPFFTTKAPGEGTGLGLSIARDIAREHGGWIAVDAADGGGARFELGWPVGANRASVPIPMRGFDAVRNRESRY
ncbi:MAG TPA: HAMP domain-containing sensor histidine kinase [Polyangiaceae bacterium]